MSVRSYLTLKEFCEHARLSEATVRRLCRKGKLPFHQPGGSRTKLLFTADALERADGRYVGPPQQPFVDPTPQIPGPEPRWLKQARKGGN